MHWAAAMLRVLRDAAAAGPPLVGAGETLLCPSHQRWQPREAPLQSGRRRWGGRDMMLSPQPISSMGTSGDAAKPSAV